MTLQYIRGALGRNGLLVRFASVNILCLASSCRRTSNPPSATPLPSPPPARVTHPFDLKLTHPGDPESREYPVTLEQVVDPAGEPEAYRTWVDSVICRDDACEVVKVQLHWNALGQFQHYEVEPGENLTKLDHVPFSEADHQKLLEILKDQESPLKEVTKEGLAPKSAAAGDNSARVKGVSGATVLTLRSTVVIGAGYTCYDLWHWANGEMTEIIRQRSGETMSDRQLLICLASEDNLTRRFALEQLKRRNLNNKETLKRVIDHFPAMSKDLVELALEYLEDAATSQAARQETLLRVFAKATADQRVVILDRLVAEAESAPSGFYDQLSEQLPEFDSYYEVHLFLNLMERRNPGSAAVIQHTLPLLKHEKFFVARRAFWFLNKQDLTKEQNEKVDAFYEAHADRL